MGIKGYYPSKTVGVLLDLPYHIKHLSFYDNAIHVPSGSLIQPWTFTNFKMICLINKTIFHGCITKGYITQVLPHWSAMNIPFVPPSYFHIFTASPMIFLCFPWDFPYDPISNPGFPAWPCTWPAQREAARGPAGRRSDSHSPSRGVSVFSAALIWKSLGISQNKKGITDVMEIW